MRAQHSGRKPGKIDFIMARELHGLYKLIVRFKKTKKVGGQPLREKAIPY